ncbi:MAG: hypothetical protein R3F30_02400 [Planctomycetota bacterium]
MEPDPEVLATLQAKARQQSIDELKAKGKTKVKVIRAKDIAALIQEAVQRAIQDSSLLTQDQVEELTHKSKAEFQELQQRWREREQAERERDAEIDRLRQAKATLQKQVDELEQRLRGGALAGSPAGPRPAARPRPGSTRTC